MSLTSKLSSYFKAQSQTRFVNVDFIGTISAINEKPSMSVKFHEIATARAMLEQGDTTLFSDLIERMLESDYDVRSAYQDVVRALQQCAIEVVPARDNADAVMLEEQSAYVKELLARLRYEGAIGNDVNALVGAMFDLRGYSVFAIDYNNTGEFVDLIKRIEPKRVLFANTNTQYSVVNEVYLLSPNRDRRYSLKELNAKYLSDYGVNAFIQNHCGTVETNKPIPLASIGFALLPLAAFTATNLVESQRILELFGRPIAVSQMKDSYLSQFGIAADTGYNKEAERTMSLAISRLGDMFGLSLPPGWELKFEEAVGSASVESYKSMIDAFKEAKIELLTGSYLAKTGAKGGTNQQAEIGEGYVEKAINYYGNQIESTLNTQLVELLVRKVFRKECVVKIDIRTESKKNYQSELQFLNSLRVPITAGEYARRLGLKLPDGFDPNAIVMPSK